MPKEYTEVEKPFLTQLAALGWQVIDQGQSIPQLPEASLRTSFRQVTLPAIFHDSLLALNPWLTNRQIQQVYDDLLSHTGSLLEANEAILEKLTTNRPAVDRNEQTGEQSPRVTIIDWRRPERNQYHAINQFRIDTPWGDGKKFIIPDIVLFVNGLPFVVVEAKAPDTLSEPMAEAFDQLQRYSNQRQNPASGIKEGEERLFHFNQFLIRTCGDKADIGTITASDNYYFPWRDIYPPEYENYEPPLGVVRPQEILIQGALNHANLLDLVRAGTLFMDKGGKRLKIIARYQQFRAMLKIIDRLRNQTTADERSGVVWHTQGSGKSLTMVFTIRKLRLCNDLKDFKVLMVNDRRELEDQLSETATLTGERVHIVDSTAALKTDLATSTSNLNMVMVHKFQEQTGQMPTYFQEALTSKMGEPPPQYSTLGTINNSDRILIMIDEAHRTQSGDLSNNLFEAFPNATRIGFTGTPLITERHKSHRTHLRFGGYIDKYRLKEAIDDEVIVQILYEGRASNNSLARQDEFETKFADICAPLTVKEELELKKRYGTQGDIMEADAFIADVAADLVDHYITTIFPGGFKAQVVGTSKLAVWKLVEEIRKALTAYIATQQAQPNPNHDLIRRIQFIKVAGVISGGGTNEDARFTELRREAAAMNAVPNFKKAYDLEKPDTAVGILVVCDMLRVGFDAPVEQVMYIAQKIKEHNLLQTMTRVNRIYPKKEVGYIVDYVGLTDHLKEALKIYSGGDDEDYQDIQRTLASIETEIPVLEARYQRLLQFFQDHGVVDIEPFVQQQIRDTAADYQALDAAVQLLEDIKRRSTFHVLLRQFAESMDIILPKPPAAPYRLPLKRFGHILIRAQRRYQDETLNIASAGQKVRQLINDHLISHGIDPQIPPTPLIAKEFAQEVAKAHTPRTQASTMIHAIRKHIKINIDDDPALYSKLSEKLEAALQQYQDDWVRLLDVLHDLRDDAIQGRQKATVPGLTPLQASFYDRLAQLAFNDNIPPEEQEAVKKLIRDLTALYRERTAIIGFWQNSHEQNRLKGDVSDLILFSGVDTLFPDYQKLTNELTALAKARHGDIHA
ncbi:MAG TPA: HsdR family type I site-specific deoxyribonuclease [Anaerolineae bacterium]|nr:HsdR family type I site-specific deoxyribonuclease [Anaerolineae bacterium]